MEEILIYANKNPVIASHIIEEVGPRLCEIVLAAQIKALNRYNVKPGRIFGRPGGKERFKIIDISGNTIFYKDLVAEKVLYKNVDELLESWNLQGVVEITQLDEILATVKKYLTPFLGGALVAALIAWIMNKIGK